MNSTKTRKASVPVNADMFDSPIYQVANAVDDLMKRLTKQRERAEAKAWRERKGSGAGAAARDAELLSDLEVEVWSIYTQIHAAKNGDY